MCDDSFEFDFHIREDEASSVDRPWIRTYLRSDKDTAMRPSFSRQAGHSLQIFGAGVGAVQADALLDGADWMAELSRPLSGYDQIAVTGMGKASIAMAAALQTHLDGRKTFGWVSAPYGYAGKGWFGRPPVSDDLKMKNINNIGVIEAGHPLPDKESEMAGRFALVGAECLGPDDLLIVLASGGGSSLCVAFPPGISLEDAREAFYRLLVAGADIHAINKVRRRISHIGGGGLARAAAPAEVLTLCLSDVPGDDTQNMYVIGGGPTLPDPYTAQEALDILKQYGDKVPASVWQYVEESAGRPEPSPSNSGRVHAVLLGSVRTALEAAAAEAKRLGYRVEVVSREMSGEAREVGEAMARRALAQEPGWCLLWGGETSVTVRGDGLGGRNQELALAAAIRMAGEEKDVSLMSAGTDGIDGPTDAAGAIATPDTAVEARQRDMDPEAFLKRNDAYGFWHRMPGFLQTGPTHTNVMDIQIVLT